LKVKVEALNFIFIPGLGIFDLNLG